MTSLPVADYVTLYKKDCRLLPKNDNVTPSGIMEWDIPQNAYYYKDRGNMCLVSLADCAIQTDGSGFQNLTINYEGTLTGGLAEQKTTYTPSTINNNVGTLAVGRYFDGSSDAGYIWNFSNGGTEPIKLLTAARPSTIRLYVYEGNKNEINFDGANNQDAIFVLRFDYLDPIVENEKISAVSYKPAFPSF